MMALIQIRISHKTQYKVFCGLYCRGVVGLHTIRADADRRKGVLAESEATFPLSRSWKMMRPICSMQGETVPCRLTDFKAVRLCYVPPSLILETAGGLLYFFFPGAQILNLDPPPGIESLPEVLTDLQ